jgi:hypothetical protein
MNKYVIIFLVIFIIMLIIGVIYIKYLDNSDDLNNIISYSDIDNIFNNEGFLVHMIGYNQVNKWKNNEVPWFSIDCDCGTSCSAWSLERKDIPFIVYLSEDYNTKGGWDDQGIGYISNVLKLNDKIVAMSPIDSNTVNRSCCTPYDQTNHPAGFDVTGKYNPSYCESTCNDDDIDCQANHAGGGVNLYDLSQWKVDGCNTPEEIQNGKCSLCKKGGVGAPYWCDNKPFPNINSGDDWMNQFGYSTGNVSIRQCKFRKENWETWIDSIKLFHDNCQKADKCENSGYYFENEVNLYFNPNKKEKDQKIWNDSIMGIFYLDMGDNITYNKDNAKKLATEMVQKYNKDNKKQIKLYKVVTELPGNVKQWQNGKNLNLSKYVTEVKI